MLIEGTGTVLSVQCGKTTSIHKYAVSIFHSMQKYIQMKTSKLQDSYFSTQKILRMYFLAPTDILTKVPSDLKTNVVPLDYEKRVLSSEILLYQDKVLNI